MIRKPPPRRPCGRQEIKTTLPLVDLNTVRRVLIVKLSALGDIIHALPVSAALHDAFPHLEITWAVEEPFAALVQGNPCITSVLVLPKLRGNDIANSRFRSGYFQKIQEACIGGVDLSLDLQGLTKSAVIAYKSGARIRLGYHWLREAAPLMEKPVPRRNESVHIVDQYLDVARALGAAPTRVRFPFYIDESDDAAAVSLLSAQGVDPEGCFIAVNPASAQAVKQWGAARFAEVMDRLKCDFKLPCVLVTADKKVAGEVAAAASEPFADLSGKTSLKQLAAVLKRSAVHLCGDTGSGHLAAALERPVVSLMGPTDPDRACPYGQRENTISERASCGMHCTGRRCEFQTPRCMGAINPDIVVERLSNLASGLSLPARIRTDSE